MYIPLSLDISIRVAFVFRMQPFKYLVCRQNFIVYIHLSLKISIRVASVFRFANINTFGARVSRWN